jgi:hypothetical protein
LPLVRRTPNLWLPYDADDAARLSTFAAFWHGPVIPVSR